jgi:delta-1-pyrroline-5-carboxylate synthetase
VESKQDIKNLLKLDKHIDLVIPRGSSKMVANIQSNTKIPVLGHAEGICHIYIDEFANFEKAVRIVLDSKTDYPAACNAVETVLIHDSWLENGNAEKLIKLLGQNGVKVFGGPLIAQTFNLQPAESFKIEYSSLSLTLEPVKTLNDAIAFINRYSSGHTESIITENIGNANQFLREVDSSSVFHNASTRFADGYRYGLGAEVGISTGRIHARGPVGVEGLLTTKWNLRSNSDHCVGDFSGKGQKKLTYTHKNMLSSKM